MDRGSAESKHQGSASFREENEMGLFRRKAIVEDEGERCPRCTERVPEGASECAMCGADLRPLRSLSPGPQVEQGAKR
jgi:hypothetical protein